MNGDVESWRWVTTDEGSNVVASIREPVSPSAIAHLRKALTPEQVTVAIDVARARRSLEALFPDRRNPIGDSAGAQMASSRMSAAHKAARFLERLRSQARVTDLCCGIGSDTWALHRAGLRVTAVDIDPRRAWMCSHNTGISASVSDVSEAPLASTEAFHLDPARRSKSGKRSLDPSEYSPGPADWERLLQSVPSGCIKLNPGIDAELLPEGELEIISEAGRLTQALLWTGDLASDNSRTATLLHRDGRSESISGFPDRPFESSPLQDYIAPLDPSLERTELVSEFLAQSGLDLLHPGTGLVTAPKPVQAPLLDRSKWFRVLDDLPWNLKRVRSALRSINAGIVTVRTRAGVVNPDEITRNLSGDPHNAPVTLFVLPVGGPVRAIITESARETPSAETATTDGAQSKSLPGGTG